MSRYTLHREADGSFYILEAGARHTPCSFRPVDEYEENVLRAMMAMLNRREFTPTDQALKAMTEAGVPASVVHLDFRHKAYGLYVRMRSEDGLGNWRP